MIDSRLFGGRPWFADQEVHNAMSKRLRDLGLDEQVPGKPGTTRSTNLGNEHRLDLMMVFMGHFGEWDVAWILEKYGLIDELERDKILDRLEANVDPEFVMLTITRRAYFEFYNPSRLLN